MDTNQKNSRYERLFQQINELMCRTHSPIARMATVTAILHHKMDYFFWTGFYLFIDGDLIVGPYQGPLACQLLERGKGVCWAGFSKGISVVVPDVHKFPGHIACDGRSKSEIVVPFRNHQGEIAGVLDVDSKEFNSFDEIDAKWLQRIVDLIYSFNEPA
jgi:L-methionine (R)-S-oxide reductase